MRQADKRAARYALHGVEILKCDRGAVHRAIMKDSEVKQDRQEKQV